MTNSRTILVADDDAAIRTVISHALTRAGFEVRTAANLSTLWQWVQDGIGDAVITDVVMPDENGLDFIPQIHKARPHLPVIVISAQNTLSTAVRANEQGAFEYLPKPFDINELERVVKNSLQKNMADAAPPLNEGEEDMPLIGRSAAMQDVYRIMARVVSTDLTVMITGESGTGKELVARAMHDLGKRRNGPFVALNMAAIPAELIESELFGHEKGAFTGAVARSSGKFEQAQGGTLFLDEIGDMPIDAQTRLLRVLQEGEFTTVGGRRTVKTNVRVVAATNKNPAALVTQGLLREDLYFRLNVIPIRLPSLRERGDDVALLTNHFFEQASKKGLPKKSLDQAAMNLLMAHSWPGNVRELENLIRRLAALCPEDVIGVETLRVELNEDRKETQTQDDQTGVSLGEAVEYHIQRYFAAHGHELPPVGVYERVLHEVERPLIMACLEATRGNQLKAAELLGINRNTLRKKIQVLQIKTARSFS